MTDRELRKRARWLDGVAGHVEASPIADLLRGYARGLAREADRIEIVAMSGVYQRPAPRPTRLLIGPGRAIDTAR